MSAPATAIHPARKIAAESLPSSPRPTPPLSFSPSNSASCDVSRQKVQCGDAASLVSTARLHQPSESNLHSAANPRSPPIPSSIFRAQSATMLSPPETARSAHARTVPSPQTGNHPPARHSPPPPAPALPTRPVSYPPSSPQAPSAGTTAQIPAFAATAEIPPAHFSSAAAPSPEIPHA